MILKIVKIVAIVALFIVGLWLNNFVRRKVRKGGRENWEEDESDFADW